MHPLCIRGERTVGMFAREATTASCCRACVCHEPLCASLGSAPSGTKVLLRRSGEATRDEDGRLVLA